MAAAPRSAPRPSMTFAVLALGVSAYSLLQALILPALPTLQRDLHTTQNAATWLLTAFLLSASVFTPIFGRIGDTVGKERMLVASLAALALGSLMAALATSISLMLAARVVQGVGGGVMPLAFGILRDEMPRERVSSSIGFIAALSAMLAGLSVTCGGVIVHAWGYHWLFWPPFVGCVVVAIATHFTVPESPVRAKGSVNWIAATLLAGWLVALLLAISEGPTWGWASWRVVGLFVLSVGLTGWWMHAEWHADEPVIDLRMMARPAVWTCNLVALLTGIGLYAGFAFVPSFVQTDPVHGYGFGASLSTAGLFLAPQAGGMFISGVLAGRLVARVGPRLILIVGALILVSPFPILAAAHAHSWEVYLAMGLMGLGFGLAFSAMSMVVVAAVPPEQTGVASGMNANIRTIGGSIGAAMMASIVTSGVAPGGVPKESGYTHGFAVLGIAALIAAAAAMLVPRPGRRGDEPTVAVAALAEPVVE